MTTTRSTASQSEFDARVAEYDQTINGFFDAMRLAASENRQAAYYDLKARCKELRNELHAAQTTGRFADGVSRETAGWFTTKSNMRIAHHTIDGTHAECNKGIKRSELDELLAVEHHGEFTGLCPRCYRKIADRDAATWTVERRAADRETNSQVIVWQWLTATMSDRAAKQLIATAVAKGEAADRCHVITYRPDDGIFRLRTTA